MPLPPALRRNIVDTAHGHLNLSFDLAKSLAAANNLSEIVQLQAAYWRKQFNTATTQAEEVRHRTSSLAWVSRQKRPRLSASESPVNKASPRAEEAPKKRHSCTARVPIAEAQRGDTPKLEAPPAARPTARQPDERQSETRKKSAPQEEAHQRNLPAEIKFGVLDGNAVRFTSLEAWWLVDGVWRPISPDEVLLNAAVMREARFNQFFPEVPRLPSNAFKSDNKTKPIKPSLRECTNGSATCPVRRSRSLRTLTLDCRRTFLFSTQILSHVSDPRRPRRIQRAPFLGWE